MKVILRWLATALAVGVAIWLVPGIEILGGMQDWAAIAIFALVLALINMCVRPILQVLSLPITVITLGLFHLVVNTLMLYVATWVANGIFHVGFSIDSFWSAFVASLVISIVAAIVNAITGANRKR
ncbi:MAG: phage holin family protein [Eggerthellaceae bacterium]|nr:phage holin family protein [Eggerthellaceae bacterium]